MTKPEKLQEIESAMGRGWPRLFVYAFIVGWLLLIVGDWSFRFGWFRWQEGFISRPAPPAAESPLVQAFRTNRVAATRGGDLSHMLDVPSLQARYAEERPGYLDIVDAKGYRNFPNDPKTYFPVVVVGDSFMTTGAPMTNMFSTQLSERVGVPVFNRAKSGRGAHLGITLYADDARFKEHPPRVLVWGFVERDVSGAFFAKMTDRLARREESHTPNHKASLWFGRRIYWSALTPAALKDALPSTSVIARLAEKIWNRLRWDLFRQVTPQVIMGRGPDGEQMLYYSYALKTMRWPPEVRGIEDTTAAIQFASDFFAERGTRLVVLLIPDKEQVYRADLPERVRVMEGGLPASCLWALEEQLREREVQVINLLPLFRERAARGLVDYWRDDTHWNAAGIRVAAEKTQELIQPWLEPGRTDLHFNSLLCSGSGAVGLWAISGGPRFIQ